MSDKKLSAISLFSGCGGADLGLIGGFDFLSRHYEKTSIEIVHASDINQKAVETYNLNFSHKALCADVLGLDFKESSADLVIGGFPCQNFSTLNPNKQPEDINNQLFWELAKVTEQVKPKIVIGENVKGFYQLSNGKYLNMIVNRLKEIGYTPYAKLLNAANFGVPQLRVRVIIVGIRNDIKKKFYYPDEYKNEYYLSNSQFVPIKHVIDSIFPPDEKYYFSDRAVQGVKNAKPNMKRALAQNLDEPSLTITSHLAKVSLNSRDPVLLVDKEKEKYRRFTPREAARIQSFPDSFIFAGSEADAYRQIGNAVPPVLFWNVIQALKHSGII